MSSALTAGFYSISSAITSPYLALWFDNTQAPTPVQGIFDPLGTGIWNFAQKGGKWSIKDLNSGLYFGYNTSKPQVSTPIMAVKNEILWDIVQSDMSGYYQLSVPSTKLTATLADLNFEGIVSLHLSHANNGTVANGVDSRFWQDWALGLNLPLVKIEKLIGAVTVTSTVTGTSVTVTAMPVITTMTTATRSTFTIMTTTDKVV